MATRNKRAAKAARREAKAERKSANALGTNYSSLKKLNMGQTNKIGVMVKVKTSSGVNNFVAFETDNEEFLPIYNAVTSTGYLEFQRLMFGYEIVNHFENQKPPNFEFSMLAMKFISTTPYHKCIANNGGISFGVVVDLDETRSKAETELFDYDEWKALLNIEINTKKGHKVYC